MTEPEKPFVAVRSRFMLQITPRNAEGWRAFGWWMGGLLIGTALFIGLVSALDTSRAVLIATGVFAVATLAWAWAMIRWMLARSEVIRPDDIVAFKREQERRKTGRSERRP